MRKFVCVLAALTLSGLSLGGEQSPPQGPATPPGQAAAPPASATNLGSDANGNPLRRALKTGHVSNYDEAKVAPFTLPDPLVLANGKPVRDRQTWIKERRPEILRMYETEIYGRLPEKTPAVKWEVTETDAQARDGAAVMKKITGTVGSGPDAPQIKLTLYTPATATKPVPVILLVNFGGGPPPPPTAQGRGGAGFPSDPPVAAEIISRGWGYATVGYADIQPDRLNTFTQGVIGRTLAPGQEAPAPDEWGTISAWSWGVSRMIDYFETDKSVNAKQVALFGHSRLGKTALWATAKDERIAAAFSSCSGEMGAALARRDWGETVDDMAQNFPWQFAGTLPEVARPLERDASRCPHADCAERPAPGVHHRGHGGPVGGSCGDVQGRRRRRTGLPSARREGSGGDRPAAARYTSHDRRSRMALPHRRSHRDPRRLEGLPRLPGEVFLAGSSRGHSTVTVPAAKTVPQTGGDNAETRHSHDEHDETMDTMRNLYKGFIVLIVPSCFIVIKP